MYRNNPLSHSIGRTLQRKERGEDDRIAALAAALEKRDQEIHKFTDGANARLRDMEQKLARRGHGGDTGSVESLGSAVVNSDEYKSLAVTQNGKARIQIKATITTGATSGGALGPSDRTGIVASLPRQEITFRDVLAPGSTNSTSVEYVRQTTRTSGAGTQVEGDTKGESTLAYETVNAPVRTIATLQPASKQVLDDAPMLQSVIDSELKYLLAEEEEQQILWGDGTGVNLLGIAVQATAFAAPFTVTSPTMIDNLLLAIAQLQAAKYDADFITLNPLDWARIQLLKDAEGRYLANGPFSTEKVASLWRMPIVLTQSMPVDSFLVGAGKRGAQVFDRQQATVEISTEHSDFFARNMVMLRAEERLALAVYHPGAFVVGDFGNVT